MKRPCAWSAQTTFPPSRQYQSERAKDGIWRVPTTKADRQSRVTDAELHRKLGKPSVTCFGNLLSGDRRTLAIALVDRALMALTPEKRALVTPAQKWLAVDRLVG